MDKRSIFPIIILMCSILLCACNNNGKSMKPEYADQTGENEQKEYAESTGERFYNAVSHLIIYGLWKGVVGTVFVFVR